MSAELQARRYTLEEYLELEYQSDRRHYFYDGIVAPMTYTSDNHGLIVANLIGELHSRSNICPITSWWSTTSAAA